MPPNLDYAVWTVSAERLRHDWMRTRRAIVAMRVRIVVYGHLAYFAVFLSLNVVGGSGAFSRHLAVGCWSLLLLGMALLIMEWAHTRLLPRTPPRFSVKHSGLTQYGEDGPRVHFDWASALQLSIEADRFHPEYRSLVLSTASGPAWVKKLGRIYIPLPIAGENEIIAAVGRALMDNEICWRTKPDGKVDLLPKRLY